MPFDMSAFLAHEYDPAKAREYYLRNRQLKGRKKGKALPTTGGRPTASSLTPVKRPAKATVAPAKRANGTPKQMAELRGRLNRLEQVLDNMQARVDAAKARAGITTTTKKDAASKKTAAPATKAPSKKSSAEKKADAKSAAERYEKNKDPETSKQAQSVQDEIEEVQKKIAEARDELAAALAKLKASSSKPKPKTGPSFNTGPVRNKEGDRQNGA